jgi:Ig-like domain CHU_C associated
MRHVVSLMVVLCLAAGSVSAATFERVTDAMLVERSENVVVGHVLDSASRQREDGSIVTEYHLRVEDVLKGNLSAGTITITEFGGEAPSGLIFVLPGSARYAPDSRVVAFLNGHKDGTYFTSHMALGKFRFEKRGGIEALVRDEEGLELQNETEALTPRDPSAFLKYVREAVRGVAVGDYSTPAAFPVADQVHPSLAPRTESGADYAIKNGSTPIRWKDCETNCVIGYFWNGDQPGVANDSARIDDAMDAWNNDPNSFVNLGLGGNSLATNLTVFDNENTILLNNTSSPDFGLCNGSIACGGVWANTNTSHVFKGTTYLNVLNGDMVVRPGSYSDTAFESIVAHELGHTISLRHSNQGTPSTTNALMNSSVSLSGATLRQWDKDAMAELYGEGLVCSAPTINSTSGAGTIFSGKTRNLSVTAGGTAPFTYQWFQGSSGDTSNPIGGATNSSYTTPALTNTTSYWVRVGSCTPTLTTNSATITVTVEPCPTPQITTQPQSQNIQPNTTANLSVAATNGSPFNYQWYRGSSGDTSNPVGGATSSSFTTPMLQTTTNYWVKVINTCGLVTLSNTATIHVQTCTSTPVFTTQPASQTITAGATATMTVTTTGTAPITYQWFQGLAGDTTNPVVGATAASYTTPALQVTTSYWVRAHNNCGDTLSAQAVITVEGACAPLTILNLPTTVDIIVGNGITIVVSATGTGLTYQWYQGESPNTSTPVAGATDSALPLDPFLTVGTFRYWVQVKDSCQHTANSATVVIQVGCGVPEVPVISAPSITHFTSGYDVAWLANEAQTPTYELQEARDASFTVGLVTFVVNGPQKHIQPHVEITTDTRFFYRVRGIAACTQLPTAYSTTTTTVVTRPQSQNNSEFSISVPNGTTQEFTQPYLVPGFGDTATGGDTFAITTDAPWLTVFPQSGALSAGGTTVEFTINPTLIGIGSSTATVSVTRTQPSAVRGGPTTNGTTGLTLPFTISKVTPVSPTPRDANAPEGTLVVPAIAHADGIGTRFQSDVRIVNASGQPIDYELSFTPSQTNGTLVGKQLPLTIGANETKGLDDLVKAWFGAGLLGEAGLGTLEIRPLGGANPLATFASSRTYAIDSNSVSDNANCQIVRCTLGQFIPALGLDKFISNLGNDPFNRISLQQVSNSLDSSGFRTNLGFVEGSGSQATMRLTLRDGLNNILKQVERTIPPYGHEQTSLSAVFGATALSDGRVEVEVISAGGKVSSYASVVDNSTSDPLLVFPVQAQKVSAQHYVVPGVAEINNGPSSNFHTDMRVFNAASIPQSVALSYFPGFGASRPANVNITLQPGEVRAINNVIPSLWQLSATGGAVAIDAPGNASLVVTARTFSRNEDGGTFGQFIPGVTAADGVGLGERALEVLQLEQSDQYRTNLGLVEVTGNPVTVEILGQTGNKLTARTEATLTPNEFRQIGLIFQQLGFTGASYQGRVSVRVIGGNGRVAAYGSVVDNKTIDPTYVPAQ